jgi:hypothetical protein
LKEEKPVPDCISLHVSFLKPQQELPTVRREDRNWGRRRSAEEVTTVRELGHFNRVPDGYAPLFARLAIDSYASKSQHRENRNSYAGDPRTARPYTEISRWPKKSHAFTLRN